MGLNSHKRGSIYSRRSRSQSLASSLASVVEVMPDANDDGDNERIVMSRGGGSSYPRGVRMGSTRDIIELPAHRNSNSSTKKEDAYATHRYLLHFTNKETEQRYFEFQYVDNSFIPGKMFALMWTGVAAVSFVAFTEPFSNGASYTVESFGSPWWIGGYVGAVLMGILWVCLFIDALRHYREIIHLAQMFIGWPHLVICILYIKRPQAYSYCFILGCFMFAIVIAQCRFRRSLPFITLWPLACMIAITFGVPDYWTTHTYLEMMYWGVYGIPLFLLIFLEKQTRKSFMEREIASAAIAEIEHKTTVTRRMIANFFPVTPTRDLLQVADGPRDKLYPDTVMVVTDIAGFTAHTARSNPPDVIDMLTEMFRAFDATAEQYDVEKIATVGDSYCGAIFPCGRKCVGERSLSGLLFACSTLGFAGAGLQLRVGVHVGDVVGVFVGCAPPKFDLFGAGIDDARIMEERGTPGFVHVSSAVLAAMQVPDDAVSTLARTPLGVLCQSWGDVGSTTLNTFSFQSNPIDAEDDEVALDAERIVETLCVLAGIEASKRSKPQSGQRVDVVDDQQSCASTETTTIYEADNAAEEEHDVFDFHPLLLKFYNSSVETKFQQAILKKGINDFCARLFVVLTFVLFVIQLNLQCRTEQDMGVVSATLAILVGLSTYIQFVGTNNPYHAAITFVAYNAILVISFLALTVKCGGLVMREKYVGDIAGCYFAMAVFAPQYTLDVRLIYRCGFAVATVVLCIVCIAIRRNTIYDEVAKVDPVPLCGLGFVIMSFFPDFSLRSAFRSEMQLKRLRRTAKSKSAAMATSALSIMLPGFVTERIVALAKEARDAQSHSHFSDTATNSSGGSGDVIGDLDLNAMTATWEYSHAIVMFVKFHSDSPLFTPEAINLTVKAVEDITKRFEVMKVKTIGSTVMLVAGIDDPRARQDQLSGMVDAAIAIRALLFQKMNVPGLVHRIGVHCGACFGAVIGGHGAIFDLFGDTVNTASRMCSFAGAGEIQLSFAASLLLLPRLQSAVEARAPVNMKGKGAMEVRVIGDGVGLDHLPQASVSEFTQELSASLKYDNSGDLPQPGCADTLNRSAVVQWRLQYDDEVSEVSGGVLDLTPQ